MNRNVRILLTLEFLYKDYFDRTGDLMSRVDFLHNLKAAMPYVRVG